MPNKTCTNANHIVEAAKLGRIAFGEGRACVPGHDPAMMKLLERNRLGESIQPMIAWRRAWQRANIDAHGRPKLFLT